MNKLTMNRDITKIINFIRKIIIGIDNIRIGTDVVEKGVYATFLSIRMNAKLNFKFHIVFLVKKE